MKNYLVQLTEVVTYTRDLVIPAESVEDAKQSAINIGLLNKNGLKFKVNTYTWVQGEDDIPPKVKPEDGQSALDKKHKDRIKEATGRNDD